MNIVSEDCFTTIDQLIWSAIYATNEIENDELESVKLFGNSQLMFDIITRLFVDPQYEFINIGSLNISASWFDQNEKDDYVLELNNDYELSIQSAWNDGKILKHEAKYAIIPIYFCSIKILESVIEENIPFLVAYIS